jgi:hypothetical protein
MRKSAPDSIRGIVRLSGQTLDLFAKLSIASRSINARENTDSANASERRLPAASLPFGRELRRGCARNNRQRASR